MSRSEDNLAARRRAARHVGRRARRAGPAEAFLTAITRRPRALRTAPARYLGAAILGLAAALVSLALSPYIVRSIFTFFLLAVLAASLLFGFGPGVLAVVISMAAIAYIFLPPERSFAVAGVENWVLLGVFGAFAVLVAALSQWLVTARRRSARRARALERRDRILEATGFGAERLLRSADLERRREFLALLGDATRVSRVYIFRNHPGPGGELAASQLLEWVAPGVTPQLGRPELQNVPYDASGMRRWRLALGRGEPILGLVARFPASERPLLESQGIVSVLVLPIFIGDEWWGFMGFDEIRFERRWSPAEVHALRTATGLIGAAIERERADRRMWQLERARVGRRLAEAAARRSRLLAEVSRILGASLDYEATFGRLAGLLVPRLADWCVLDVADVPEVRRIAVAHADPTRGDLAARIRRLPPSPESPGPVREALRAGESRVYAEVTDAMVRAVFPPGEYRELVRQLRPRSALIVPLRLRERVLGAITLVATESGRRYGPNDLALVEEIAGRAALALENARLYTDAKDATRMRDQVLAVVSHDLRNPLNTIGLSAGLLADLIPEGEAEGRRQLEVIRRSVARAARLITDLLDAARSESGRLRLKRTRVSGAAVAHEAVELHRAQAAGKEQRLVDEVPADLPELFADRDRLLQVFSNLLGNAIKFTPERGRITVEGAREHGRVRFRVSDTGPGVAAEDVPHLFDPFWQAAKRKGGGVGLGLAIARGIVAAHGGRIWAESELGKGLAVSFTIPVAGAAREPPARQSPPRPAAD